MLLQKKKTKKQGHEGRKKSNKQSQIKNTSTNNQVFKKKSHPTDKHKSLTSKMEQDIV